MKRYDDRDTEQDAKEAPAGAEETETAAEEASESPAEEQMEEASGMEDNGNGMNAKIPEVFQHHVEALLEGTNKQQLDYIRSAVMDREHALMKSETKAEKGAMFDTDGMPE